MKSVGKLRKRIEEAKADLARIEGERDGLNERIQECVSRLREYLECGPGEERAAIKELRDKVTQDEADLEELLSEIDDIQGAGK